MTSDEYLPNEPSTWLTNSEPPVRFTERFAARWTDMTVKWNAIARSQAHFCRWSNDVFDTRAMNCKVIPMKKCSVWLIIGAGRRFELGYVNATSSGSFCTICSVIGGRTIKNVSAAKTRMAMGLLTLRVRISVPLNEIFRRFSPEISSNVANIFRLTSVHVQIRHGESIRWVLRTYFLAPRVLFFSLIWLPWHFLQRVEEIGFLPPHRKQILKYSLLCCAICFFVASVIGISLLPDAVQGYFLPFYSFAANTYRTTKSTSFP